jgi:hypothetical protein
MSATQAAAVVQDKILPTLLRFLRAGLGTLALAALALGAVAEEPCGAPEQVERIGKEVRVVLEDGTLLVGRITAENDEQIELTLSGGATARVPRAGIASIELHGAPPSRATGDLPTHAAPSRSRFTRHDPNYTRLLFAPTGRPLGKGEGQLADYGVLFPGFAAGLTENLSLLGGISMIPGVGFSEQLFYVAPRLAFQTSQRTSFSTGVLYGTVGSESDRLGAGIAFAVGTFGKAEASVSAGVGYGFITFEGEFKRADKPIVMIGGERQLTDSLALVAESWLILDAEARDWPVGVGLRFFGDRISVDLGCILMQSVIEEGFPIPWLSFSYRFDRSKFSADEPSRRISTPLPPRLP